MGLPSQIDIDCRNRWEARILRARKLRDQHAGLASALRLYEAILEFQFEVASSLGAVTDSDVPLRERIDLAFVASQLPSISRETMRFGPDALALEADKLRNAGVENYQSLLHSFLFEDDPGLTEAQDFFARACLQPVTEHLQLQLPEDSNYNQNRCPACGSLPQLSILRPEGEGASRWLLCSLCFREWLFRRVICPWCSEENKEKLPRYSAQECPYIHVEACDSCLHYLKTVDMSVSGHAVPLVDEAALAVLDVWATDRGYTKIKRNLIGF